MSEPLFKVSPELLKIGDEFNRQTNEAMMQINAACEPVYDSLLEGMKRADKLLREAMRK